MRESLVFHVLLGIDTKGKGSVYLDGEGSTFMRDRRGPRSSCWRLPSGIARGCRHKPSLGAHPAGFGEAIGPEQNVFVHDG